MLRLKTHPMRDLFSRYRPIHRHRRLLPRVLSGKSRWFYNQVNGDRIDIDIGMNRRRVTGRSNTAGSRGPMPGGSTSSMMRIYSDDSPGLRVYVTRAYPYDYLECH